MSTIQSCLQERKPATCGRFPQQNHPHELEDNMKLPVIAVNMIITQVLMNSDSQKSFSSTLEWTKKSTGQDDELTRLKGYINTGFPSEK